MKRVLIEISGTTKDASRFGITVFIITVVTLRVLFGRYRAWDVGY